MPWQKLTPEIPNAPARTFVPTFIRESPLPSFVSQLYMFRQIIIIKNNNKMVLRVKKGYKQAYKSLYEPVFLAKLNWSFLQSLNFFVT